MKNMIEAALFTPLRNGRWGLPIIFWGPPGVGETEQIRQVCKKYGLYSEHLTPGERGEGAFGVTPVPIQNGHGLTLQYPPPDWVHNLRENEEQCGVVFLDEINTAPPALQPALLGAIQERRIGGHQFGPRVRVIGAANPTEQAASGWDLAPPVANRLGHISWPAVDHMEWLRWLSGETAETEFLENASVREMKILKEWPAFIGKARSEVALFIKRKPALLFQFSEGNKTWASPRSWTNAIDALASARLHELGEMDQQVFMSSFIGAPALEFFNWLAKQDLPDPLAILKGEISWKPSNKLDETNAVLEGMTETMLKYGDSPERLSLLSTYWELLELAMKKSGEDIVLKHAQAMAKGSAGNYKDSAAGIRVLKKLGETMQRVQAGSVEHKASEYYTHVVSTKTGRWTTAKLAEQNIPRPTSIYDGKIIETPSGSAVVEDDEE